MKELKVYEGKLFGVEVSNYGLKRGYLDYKALANIVGDHILNNTLMTVTETHDWELVTGNDCVGLDADGRECDLYSSKCVDIYELEIYQYYIISESGSSFLERYTDEIVYYNSEFDIYLWGVTHFGTNWDYVLTDIKLMDGDI